MPTPSPGLFCGKSRLEFQSARERLILLGVDENTIAHVDDQSAEQKARMTLRSPVAGVVRESRASLGNVYDVKDVFLVIQPSSDDAMPKR